MPGKLEVDLVGTDGTIWSGAARSLSAPASDGEIGILPGHTPGAVRARPRPGADRDRGRRQAAVVVHGGFLSVDDDQVTVVVDGLDETATPAA